MKNADLHDNQMPQWLRDELEKAMPPSETELRHYDYMRDDFLALFKKKSPESSPLNKIIHAVFSLQGKIVHCMDELTLLPPVQAAPVLARSLSNTIPSPDKHSHVIEIVSKRVNKYSIQVTTSRKNNDTCLEINVIDHAQNIEIRPFSIAVYDEKGVVIVEPMEIGPTDNAPLFPNPSEGLYVFELKWNGNTEQLRFAFQKE